MSYSSANKFAKARMVHTKFINSLSTMELIEYVNRREYEEE